MIQELEFLKELQHELKTQDTDGQAEPRFWVVMDYKKEPCWDGIADEIVIFSPDSCDEYVIELDEIKELVNDYDLEGEALDILEEFEWMNDNEVLEWFQKYIDEHAYLVPQHEVGYIVPDTMFLTKEEAKKHIENNKHHYTSKAHTYAMTAWRAPKVEKLLEILETFDWDKVIQLLERENRKEEVV